MALTDVNFQEGEVQDYLVELPTASYVGTIDDIVTESSGSQFLVMETESAGGNIFIMSE